MFVHLLCDWGRSWVCYYLLFWKIRWRKRRKRNITGKEDKLHPFLLPTWIFLLSPHLWSLLLPSVRFYSFSLSLSIFEISYDINEFQKSDSISTYNPASATTQWILMGVGQAVCSVFCTVENLTASSIWTPLFTSEKKTNPDA